MLLTSILFACFIGSVLSVLAATCLMRGLPAHWLRRMIGYSAGLLLATATLSVLPEAFTPPADSHALFATLLAGFLGLYALQKAALWRHRHDAMDGSAHEHPHAIGRETALAILVGDGFHNFVDGVLIAAAFVASPALGWATAVAVIAHEIPQEAGDFVLLRASGVPVRRALALNALSGAASLAGALLGYFALSHLEGALAYVLVLAGASFIYVAVADLLPMLRREGSGKQVAWQTCALLAGLGTAALLADSH